jgi:methionyl-tRNA synthetase
VAPQSDEHLQLKNAGAQQMKTFYLTTPIYYPNARPHVGSAYTTIVCDVIARYKRMCGYDVAFLTGTDEHGEKLARAAAAEGKSPRDFVAEKRQLFVRLWEKLGIPVSVYPDGKPDTLRFIYTEHPDHVTSVQRLLLRARENGHIYSRRYEGRYCVSDERYVSDNTDPVNCDICGRPAELISEDNYFFKLSGFEKQLLDLYEKHPEFVQPDYRRNEVLSFVKGGLRDISVSRRRIKWGIPWPDDPEQVFYVWYDALTSYMTGIGFAETEKGSADFQKYWRNQQGEAEIVHMIGKDILRFHAIYWPAFIMAAYPDQPEMLPTTIFAHGWIYYEEDKMSKSKGNVVYPEPIVDALNSFGAPGNDALRYYLLREAPFGQDMSFSYEGFIQRYNADLANDLGNLANRTVTMLHRYFGGVIVKPRVGVVLDTKYHFLAVAPQVATKVCRYFNNYDFSRGLEEIWQLIATINYYITEQKPWTLAKEPSNREQLAEVLYNAAEALRFVAVLLCPVLPAFSSGLWRLLGQQGDVERIDPGNLTWGDLQDGTPVPEPQIIFPRLDKEKTLAKLHELAEADYDRDKPKEAVKPVEPETPKAPEAPASAPGAPQTPSLEPQPAVAVPSAPKITIVDFAKVEMRVGEVLSAEPIPGATKLLKLQVDIGTEVRQVCAGIAEYYPPEQLVGMKIILVANLQPRKLRGVESNGMILAASVGEKGKPILATFKEDVPKGAKLK